MGNDSSEERYIPTSIDDPTFFSDEGERYDFENVRIELTPEAEGMFNDVKSTVVERNKMIAKASEISIVIAIVVCAVRFVFGLLIEQTISIGIGFGVVVYGISFIICMAKMKKPEGVDFTDLEEKFADMCVEPIISQIEPGVDVSHKLVYYPMYGFIQKDGYSYEAGLKQLGKWLYDAGIMKSFNDKFKVSISINTLNANREGFFLTNAEAWSESTDSDGHTTHTKEFKGPVITVRMKHNLNGWVTCHTTSTVFGKESDMGFKKIRYPIDVENEQFNRVFNVDASSQQNAFYILSPLVIERLMELRRICKVFGFHVIGEFCVFCLNNNREYFTMPSGVKGAESITIEKYWQDLVQLVRIIYAFKDAVDLNFD